MRYLWITLGTALAHLIANAVLSRIALACLLTGMGDGQLVPVGKFLCVVLGVLNLPLLVLGTHEHPNSDFWTQLALDCIDPQFPPAHQLLWSLVFGCMVASMWALLKRKQASR